MGIAHAKNQHDIGKIEEDLGKGFRNLEKKKFDKFIRSHLRGTLRRKGDKVREEKKTKTYEP